MSKEAYAAMRPYLEGVYGNPGANHEEGREAKKALEEARSSVASVLKVRPEEIIFTSGATEANSLAIIGHIEGLKQMGRTYKDMHVITSAIEHVNILRSIEALKEKGVHVSVVFPNEEGIITPESIEKELTDKTVLVSIQHVNSEIGTVMPLRKIKKVVYAHNEEIAVHADAAQSVLFHSVLMERMGVDMLVLDGQKFGGPRGAGVLVKKKDVALASIVFGGGQEWGYRPGTENVFLAVGFAAALISAQEHYEEVAEEITTIRNFTINEIEKEIEGVVLNGSKEFRSANNINMSFIGRDSEYLAVLLDKEGYAVSTKITCDSGGGKGSDVVRVISGDEQRALSTLRITLGPKTTKKEMEGFVKALKTCVAFLDTQGKVFS